MLSMKSCASVVLFTAVLIALTMAEVTSKDAANRQTGEVPLNREARALGRIRMGKRPVPIMRLGKREDFGDNFLPPPVVNEDIFDSDSYPAETEKEHERRQLVIYPRIGRELDESEETEEANEDLSWEDLYELYSKLDLLFGGLKEKLNELRQAHVPRTGRSKRSVNSNENEAETETEHENETEKSQKADKTLKDFKHIFNMFVDDFKHDDYERHQPRIGREQENNTGKQKSKRATHNIIMPRLGYRLRSNLPALGPETLEDKRAIAVMRLGKRLEEAQNKRAMGHIRMGKRRNDMMEFGKNLYKIEDDLIPFPQNRAISTMRLGRSVHKSSNKN